MKIYKNNWYALLAGILGGIALDYLGLGILLAAVVSGVLVGLFTTKLRYTLALSTISGILWPAILMASQLANSMSMEMLSLVSEIAGFPPMAMLGITIIIIVVVSMLSAITTHILADLTLPKEP